MISKQGFLFSKEPEMPGPGPYFPSVLDLRGFAAFPFDYACYFSTDHVNGEGGIWLYVCLGDPGCPDNWSSYDEWVATGRVNPGEGRPLGNPVFVDRVQGNGHTETPCAGVVDGKVYLTYHKCGLDVGQATLLAVSEDGIYFERIHGLVDSVVLPQHSSVPEDNPHTGYFRWAENPFSCIPEKYLGYSLYVGGMDCRSAQWVSHDAVNWRLRKVLPLPEGLGIAEKDRLLDWHELEPASIRPEPGGGYCALGVGGTRACGGLARIHEIYRVFLSEDGTEFIRDAEKLLVNGPADSGDAEELSTPVSLFREDHVLLVYVGTSGQAGRNRLMTAKMDLY